MCHTVQSCSTVLLMRLTWRPCRRVWTNTRRNKEWRGSTTWWTCRSSSLLLHQTSKPYSLWNSLPEWRCTLRCNTFRLVWKQIHAMYLIEKIKMVLSCRGRKLREDRKDWRKEINKQTNKQGKEGRNNILYGCRSFILQLMLLKIFIEWNI